MTSTRPARIPYFVIEIYADGDDERGATLLIPQERHGAGVSAAEQNEIVAQLGIDPIADGWHDLADDVDSGARYLVSLYNAETTALIERRAVGATLDDVVDYVEGFVPGCDVGQLEVTLLACDEIPGQPFAYDAGEIIVRIVRDEPGESRASFKQIDAAKPPVFRALPLDQTGGLVQADGPYDPPHSDPDADADRELLEEGRAEVEHEERAAMPSGYSDVKISRQTAQVALMACELRLQAYVDGGVVSPTVRDTMAAAIVELRERVGR